MGFLNWDRGGLRWIWGGIFSPRGCDALEQVAQGGCGCPIPGGIQGQAGCGSGQPGLLVGDPAYSRGLERDEYCGPFQPRPFCDSNKLLELLKSSDWWLCLTFGICHCYPQCHFFMWRLFFRVVKEWQLQNSSNHYPIKHWNWKPVLSTRSNNVGIVNWAWDRGSSLQQKETLVRIGSERASGLSPSLTDALLFWATWKIYRRRLLVVQGHEKVQFRFLVRWFCVKYFTPSGCQL